MYAHLDRHNLITKKLYSWEGAEDRLNGPPLDLLLVIELKNLSK